MKWTTINLNPLAPFIRGLIKLHKPGLPIRPIVNWTNAPAYKMAKILIKKCTAHIPLPHVFNVRNPVHLITDLNEIPIHHDLKFASFDIKNVCSNIPTPEPTHIIASICDHQCLPTHLKQEILSLSNTLLS
jgi:hypothetical protein